jgi:hypothetical protein
MAEPDARLDMQACFVGTAVEERDIHALDECAVDLAPRVCIKYACYAAHVTRQSSRISAADAEMLEPKRLPPRQGRIDYAHRR